MQLYNLIVHLPAILTTKLFFPPARYNLVSRPRLLEKVTRGLQFPLLLISAPAGYGKTTLLAEWRSGPGSGMPVAWLTLDNEDNDLSRFLIYLSTALGSLKAGIGDSVISMLQSPQPTPPQIALTALINDLTDSLHTPFSLVLDDYHVLTSEQVHAALTFMLDHMPPQMHLVILTRADPPLPLPSLRARNQLAELRAADLRFTLEEAATFLNIMMGLNLPNENIAALEERTEGWIASLQLAALSMQGRKDLQDFVSAFTGSHHYVIDYLVEEVLNRQPEAMREFLLKTSILDRLTAPLCNALTNQTNGQVILDYLEHANLFVVPLDDEQRWYRYHHLFAELLRHRLRVQGHPLEVSLHQRASLWYEAEGYLAEAIHHALEVKDWDRSLALIEQASDALLKRGELVTLVGWYEKLPTEVVASRPPLGLSYTWALSMLGQYDKAEISLQKLEAIAISIPSLMGQVSAVQAYIARGKGDNTRAIEKSRQALALLPASDSQLRGLLTLNLGLVYWHEGYLREAAQVLNEVVNVARQAGIQYAELTAQIFLARTLASRGELRRVEELYLQILHDGGQVPILTLAHYDLCGIYYEWNDLVKAVEHLEKGLDLCTRSGNVEFQNSGHVLKAFLLLARGNPRGALAEVEVSHSLARDFNPATQARSAACHAQIALAIGDIDTAARSVARMAEDVDPHSFYRFVGLIRPRLLIAQGKRTAASELLKEYAERAAEAGWGYAMVAIRILGALAAEKQGTALEDLEEVLKSSQAEGYIRTYVDAGRTLVPLLQESARRGVLPEYIGQILNAFGDGHKKTAASTLPLVETLSQRELEVLRLVTAGLSNREIAEKLVISPGTAKTHIHNICGKLDVRNRTEAAMRAKDLNLV